MSTNFPYQSPMANVDAFNCPTCHAYAAMHWAAAWANWHDGGRSPANDFTFAQCRRCEAWSVWRAKNQIYPTEMPVEDPNPDLPDSVRNDYIEAATIVHNSPRGAAALLRLAVQKLCDHLVEGNADLNTKIGTLVKNGLDQKVQKAFDAVRVIGNEAVHPGEINLNDSPEIAQQLFKLVNLVGRRMITEPKEVDEIYSALPPEKIEGIEARDKAKSPHE